MPPVIVVAALARTNRAAVPVTITAVVVLAALVVTADPRAYQLVPSKLPCRATEPAETPALVVTAITAVVRPASPSSAVPPPVALTAVRLAMGRTPLVLACTEFPRKST